MFITLTVNDQPFHVPQGVIVMEAINASGTQTRQLCKYPDLEPIGACRTCLAQVEGMPGTRLC